jgi:membrane protease YdiL (CAAX protease family)
MNRISSAWKNAVANSRLRLGTPQGQIWVTALVYLLLITLAEYYTTDVDPRNGVIFHCVILAALLVHGSIIHRQLHRRFIILLSLAPLIRLLSLSMPLSALGLPMIYWYMIIGTLLFMAAFIAGWITDLRGQRIGWSWGKWPVQLLIGLSGFGIGALEYLILKPGLLAAYATWVDVITASLILLIFTGVLEEYIFRGLLQSASMQIMGRFGLLYIAVLFAILHFGYHSALDILFVFLVGLLFGILVWRTHSLIGASLAHGIANISLYVFLPLLLNSGPPPAATAVVISGQNPTPVKVIMNEIDTTAAAKTGQPSTDALVDDGDLGMVHVGKGLWSDTNGGYGGSFFWTFTNPSMPEAVVTWLPSLQGCGSYQVEAHIPVGNGLTDAARYRIGHRHGMATVDVSQEAFNGAWIPLGIFEFESGGQSFVQLSNMTGEDPKLLRWISFDAMRWIVVGPCVNPSEPHIQ